MSYQSFGLRRLRAAAALARRKPARPLTLTGAMSSTPPTVAVRARTSVSRAAKPVPRRLTAPRLLQSSNRTGRFVRLVVEVSEKLELHDGSRRRVVGDPAPYSCTVGLEIGVDERVFEPGGIRGPARDLHVELDVHIGRARVTPSAAGAQQLWNEPAEYHELRAATVVVDHPNERGLGGGTRSARTVSVRHLRPPRRDARRLPRRGHRTRASRRRPAAHGATRVSPTGADKPLGHRRGEVAHDESAALDRPKFRSLCDRLERRGCRRFDEHLRAADLGQVWGDNGCGRRTGGGPGHPFGVPSSAELGQFVEEVAEDSDPKGQRTSGRSSCVRVRGQECSRVDDLSRRGAPAWRVCLQQSEGRQRRERVRSRAPSTGRPRARPRLPSGACRAGAFPRCR